MGFDDCRLFGEQTASFVSAAIGQVGVSAGQASHAIGELTKALNGYSHAEGCSNSTESRGLRRNHGIIDTVIQPTSISSLFEKKHISIGRVVKMSIVRKPVLKFNETNSVAFGTKIDWDVLEKNFGPFNSGDVVFYK